MIKATVNGARPFEITPAGDGPGHVECNGKQVDWSTAALPSGGFSILMDGKSLVAEVVKTDPDTKTITIQINQALYEVALQEPIDRLLASMGISETSSRKLNDIKAPMPGMVLKVLVTPGQAIKKGDPVLILEAMKMENVFKAAADAVVKEIKVAERTAVEKGEVLIVLE
ncbi:acetyl-CoA carboxylase biotin carboxyl carrier protein subunit [Chitinophaga alhagiae]|uniref:Acetyl-CoA carboxylase biotin carboxyl carrier protein subunit n=1 Tax=Chitinophaga alhagiae TaxID=2203219 RepID=A0ABN5LWL2_9BACT|nr:acetyl-CoA carboxylase biotin carboxyl carrier protein subunit [Chitinophaga alhagiae]AWO02143.1 acetyl-CoA carboxylase biotin carboxyl carrier protein subunit [Chitinophaga alhagiae]